jgi:predicted phosphodiesterase
MSVNPLTIEVVTPQTSVRVTTKKQTKVIAIGDVHVPFHDPVALDLFLRVSKTIKPSALIVAGDFIDFYAISRFVRTPERRLLLAEEIRQARELLQTLSKAFPRAEKIFMCGNHEKR